MKEHQSILEATIAKREAVEAEIERVKLIGAECEKEKAELLADGDALESPRKIVRLSKCDSRANLVEPKLRQLNEELARIDGELGAASNACFDDYSKALSAVEQERRLAFNAACAPFWEGGTSNKFFVPGPRGMLDVPIKEFFEKTSAWSSLVTLRLKLTPACGHSSKRPPLVRAKLLLAEIPNLPSVIH